MKYLIPFLFVLVCLSCIPQKKELNKKEEKYLIENIDISNQANSVSNEFIDLNTYTFEIFKTEFKEYYEIWEIPLGTCFWDEYPELLSKYNLNEKESKLLGHWMNITFTEGPSYHHYSFFPNKLFALSFFPRRIQFINENNLFLNKAFGTWEIVNDIVKITIHSIMTVNSSRNYPNNKDIFLVDSYTINFININDIGEEGFTKRPINDTILSEELLQMVTILEPNKSNNLYVRNVYTIDLIPETKKNYGYFTYFPEMAQNNHSGLEIATNPELIRRYIPDWMF
jgi:hypothetical protein